MLVSQGSRRTPAEILNLREDMKTTGPSFLCRKGFAKEQEEGDLAPRVSAPAGCLEVATGHAGRLAQSPAREEPPGVLLPESALQFRLLRALARLRESPVIGSRCLPVPAIRQEPLGCLHSGGERRPRGDIDRHGASLSSVAARGPRLRVAVARPVNKANLLIRLEPGSWGAATRGLSPFSMVPGQKVSALGLSVRDCRGHHPYLLRLAGWR
jgi:hypothetical protein